MANALSPMSLGRTEYPDPFLDVASTKLPKSRQKLLEMCFLFATTHPQISPIVKKLAKYPITRVIVNTENSQDSLREKWEDALEKELNIYEASESVGLDFFGYGNCFVTIHKPFKRFYTCKACEYPNRAGTFMYHLKRDQIHGTCPKCKAESTFEPRDDNVAKLEEISVVRLQPQKMRIERNDLTGQKWFFYDPSHALKRAVKGAKPNRDLIDTTPWHYVEAAIKGKRIKFKPGQVLHLSEPSLSGRGMAWGNPIIMAALKDAYLNQVYKKADESLANERSIPARFVFPQATSQDPLRTISLARFSGFLQNSLQQWRRDKNAVMPAPFPVGVAEVGGDSNRFTTAQLRELAIKEIIGSTGVPEGFLADGMTWSGGSVQLRMLENMLMSYLRALNRLVWFVVDHTSSIMGWPKVKCEYKPFRMADDVQMLQILIQLGQMKVVSWKEVLDRMDLTWDDQHNQVKDETDKMQEVHIQEQMLNARAALQAADIQTETQMRGEAWGALSQEMFQDDSAMVSHFKGEGDYRQLDEQQEAEAEQEQQAQSEMEQRQQQTEMRLDDAKAQKYQAEAEQKGVHADMAADSLEQKVPQVVQAYVDDLMQMPPKERGSELEMLAQQSPRLAQAVEERLAEMEQRHEAQTERPMQREKEEGAEQAQQQQQEEQEPQPQTPSEFDTYLRNESKNAKEYAEKLQMLPRGIRLPVFDYVRKTDPEFSVLITQHLGLVGGREAPSTGSVDMRPMPQQKPPRRG